MGAETQLNGSTALRFSSPDRSNPGGAIAEVKPNGRLPLTASAVLEPSRRRESILPRTTSRFFIDGDQTKRLDTSLPIFREVSGYIDSRLETFVIRANERNRQLFEEKPYLKEFLTHRFHIAPEEATEERLLQALSEHMVVDKPTPYQDANGVYYLPFDDIAPNDQAFKNKRFNWDTEMHLAAVLHSNMDNKMDLAKGSMRNAMYLFDVLGYVPNAAARGLDDRTQPPRHTTMIRMIWDAMSPAERETPENQKFFKEAWDFAEREYWQVFNAKDPQNQYSSKDPLHQNIMVAGELVTIHGSMDVVTYNEHSALGGGWDHSKRAYRREADHSRIDTQMYLYQYEEDFAWRAQGTDKEDDWKARMNQRRTKVFKDNYDPQTGWFNDKDFKNGLRSNVETVTGLFALRLLDNPQQRMDMLMQFEEKYLHPFGVGLTDVDTLPAMNQDKADAIRKMEPDHPGMQITLRDQYNHEQWEGRRQFYIITKQVRDELRKAISTETDPQVLEKLVALSEQVTQRTLVGLVQYFEKVKEETGEGKLPEKLEAETGKMGDGAQYGDQDELVMPFGVYKLFMSDYNDGRPEEVVEHELFSARELVTV